MPLKLGGRVRVMQQMEVAECGLACLGMVLDFHGHRASLPELRDRFGTSRNGHNLLELLTYARQLGLEGRGLSGKLPMLAKVKAPSIAHWENNHFVVVERHSPTHLVIVDPASGRRRVAIDAARRMFSGVALELGPGPAFQRRKRHSSGVTRYVQALRRQRGTLAFVVLANIVQHILAVGTPAANQVLIDHVIAPGRSAWLLPMLAVLAITAAAQLLLHRLHGLSQSLLRLSLGIGLAREMGSRLLCLPMLFLDSRSHGDLIERVNMQTELQDLLADTVHAVFDLFLVALLVTLMVVYDPALGGISVGLTVARIAVVRWARRPISQRTAAELAARGREAGALAEATSSVEMTKGFGAEDAFVRRFGERVRERADWGVGSARLEAALGQTMAAVDTIMLATILWVGGQQVISGAMTVGVFIGFLTIRSMVERPMGSLVSLVESWIRVRGILERCDDILGTRPCRDGASTNANADTDANTVALGAQLRLDNLGFRYGSGPWIVQHANLHVEPGQHVAIVGPSGQGKSTLLKLLCGLLEPSEGRVLIGGTDVRELGHEAFARRCGVVLQEPLILEGTVRDAIALRFPAASDEQVFAAAQAACFDEVVAKLNGGYGAWLEPMGRNLSGGERQRLAIAQALLGEPDLLVLDEGTCSLDPDVERRVLDNIARMQTTVVSVAHRESAIGHADRVVFLHGELHDASLIASGPQAPTQAASAQVPQ